MQTQSSVLTIQRYNDSTICLFVALLLCTLVFQNSTAAENEWPAVGGDKGCLRYSSLDQINRQNVGRLQVAWTYHTGDAGKGTTIECTPIIIGGVMYVTTLASKFFALDAATGRERWKYDPYDAAREHPQPKASGGVNRGLA